MRKKAVYALLQTDLIGQVAGELICVRSLFPAEQYDLTIVAPNPDLFPRTNRAFFNMATRYLDVKFFDDGGGWSYAHENRTDKSKQGIFEKDGILFILVCPEQLLERCGREFGNKHLPFKCDLNEEEKQKGLVLRESLKIPAAAKIVTLHVRESGYHTVSKFLGYRDADIMNYVPAIKWLIEQGYYVVRLGDPSMKRMGQQINSENFIDTPFVENQDDFICPYFIATSEFYIGTLSEPCGVAQIFHVPILLINNIFNYGNSTFYKGLVSPKKYWSRSLQRYLSYEEILLSPAPNFNRIEQFSDSEVELQENSPDLILRVVQEMRGRLNCEYPGIKEYDERILQIIERQNILNNLKPPKWGIGIATMPYTQLSHEFIKSVPGFLGQKWTSIKTDQTHKILNPEVIGG